LRKYFIRNQQKQNFSIISWFLPFSLPFANWLQNGSFTIWGNIFPVLNFIKHIHKHFDSFKVQNILQTLADIPLMPMTSLFFILSIICIQFLYIDIVTDFHIGLLMNPNTMWKTVHKLVLPERKVSFQLRGLVFSKCS
jgi:hypothetical protein